MATDRLTRAVVAAVRAAPCSLRALADAASVPPSTLSRIVTGTRAATPAVAAAVSRALRVWGARCDRLADRIGHASSKGDA